MRLAFGCTTLQIRMTQREHMYASRMFWRGCSAGRRSPGDLVEPARAVLVLRSTRLRTPWTFLLEARKLRSRSRLPMIQALMQRRCSLRLHRRVAMFKAPICLDVRLGRHVFYLCNRRALSLLPKAHVGEVSAVESNALGSSRAALYADSGSRGELVLRLHSETDKPASSIASAFSARPSARTMGPQLLRRGPRRRYCRTYVSPLGAAWRR